MLTEIGIDPEASCLAATPADIQWMVRTGYGVALITKEPFSTRVLRRDQLQGLTGLPTLLLFTTKRPIT